MGLIPLGILSSAGSQLSGTYELIETHILGSAASSITFSGLSAYASTYKHLQIRLAVRASDNSSASLRARFNESISGYNVHYLYGNGTSVLSASFTALDIIATINTQTTTGAFSVLVMDVLDAYSTTKNKVTRHFSGAASEVGLGSNLWQNTAAVSSMEWFIPGKNLAIGSRFSLYGIRG
jgi:hypothetical protein